MMVHPRLGQSVRVHYARRWGAMPLQDRVGVVRAVASGRGPRNHGVEIDGRIYAVPCGNLRPHGERSRLVSNVTSSIVKQTRSAGTQLHLWLGRWADLLPASWPVVPPWGDLTDSRVVDVIEYAPERQVILLESSGHRWQLHTFRGVPWGSGGDWLDNDGRQYRRRPRVGGKGQEAVS